MLSIFFFFFFSSFSFFFNDTATTEIYTLSLHDALPILAFRGEGASLFREALDQKIRQPEALKMWYLSIIDELAQQEQVSTVSIQGARWAEIDCHEDLLEAKKLVEYLAGAPVQFV